MKTVVFTALGVALGIGVILADNNRPQPSPQPNKGTVPIFIRRENIPPKKYAPSLGITMTANVSECGLSFNLPFPEIDYPVTVELELESEPYGFWTATFTDPSSCELEFDVSVGDYRISIITSESTEYAGYFTLE